MVKTLNKYDNFSKAVKRLNEANTLYKSHSDDDIYQDAIIKRFEFTFELAWKTLREAMLEQGYNIPFASPKGVLSSAFESGIIENEDVWLSMLSDRNVSVHDYGRDQASAVAERISEKYAKELHRLCKLIGEYSA